MKEGGVGEDKNITPDKDRSSIHTGLNEICV